MTIAPTPPTRQKKVYYPVRDGKPMAETDKHADLMIYTKVALQIHYADQPNVYVSGNNFVFYQEGDPTKRVSPDCYVVYGSPKHQRDSFMSWREEGRLPRVVFEFTSRKTATEDINTKRPLYESVLQVDEYFLFDPTGDYLKPRLQGFRLIEGRYRPIPLENDRLHSEQLGLDLVQQGETMRLYDPQRGVFLLTGLEMARQAVEEAQRTETALQYAAIEAQRAQSEGQRAVSEAQRADAEAQRAEAEAQRAEAEAQARAEAEAEVARLRAELAALRSEKQA